MFDLLRQWRDVRFFPLLNPPKGKACEAINVLRSICDLRELKPEVFRTMLDKPLDEFDLWEAETAETWVDPDLLKWKFTWEEIESFDGDSKKFTPGLYNSMFDHLQRIPERHDRGPAEPGEVYSYRQDRARVYWWKRWIPFYFLWFPLLLSIVGAIGFIIFHSLTETTTRTSIWNFMVDVWCVIYDYIFPILVGISSIVWLVDYTFKFFTKRE